MTGSIMDPKHVNDLIPGTMNVTLPGKKDFADD